VRNQLGTYYSARVGLQVSKLKDRKSATGTGKKTKLGIHYHTKEESKPSRE